MKAFAFKIYEGETEAYVEEILALSKEDAVDLALDALREMRQARPSWTTASLTDHAGDVVWDVANVIDIRDETAPPE